MKSVIASIFLLAISLVCVVSSADENWNEFRGPSGDGVSTAKDLPIEFGESKNVRWKTLIPDSGWSSPVIWENEIWLTTGSDEKKELRAVCVDLKSGKITKSIKVFEMIERKIDPAYAFDSPHLNSPATPTPVVEEYCVYVSFGEQGIACLNRTTGDKIWERRDLRIYQPVRQGSSPIVDDKNLYVAFDGTDQQYFVALDKATGETRWKTDRNIGTDWEATLRLKGLFSNKGGKPNDNKKSFATATLIVVDGQRQLIAPAAEATISYDPDTGKELWRVMYPGGFNVAARPIYANGLVYVFTSGLNSNLMAIKPDGRGNVTDTHIAWSTAKSTPIIPSPIIVDDLLFMVTDKGGIARCLDAKTGEEFWRKRLGGDHWASPIYADGKLYFSSKQGDVTVLAASRELPEVMVKNALNTSFIASPAVAGNSLILRSTTHLYCLANGFERTAEQVAADEMPEVTKPEKTAIAKADIAKAENIRTDWDEAYSQLLKKNAGVREKVESGGASKEQLIAWMKQQAGGKTKEMRGVKPGSRPGSVVFYAIVIGKLKSKDIELGELTMDVDYVIGDGMSVKEQIVGKDVKLVGVAGQFLDNLLQIKRGETIKVRTGDYNSDKKELGFGFKFQVLERTSPFRPEDFGVPPDEFRGFRGELVGTIVEAIGYEVLLDVTDVKPADGNNAADAASIEGKRIRIAEFYNNHADAFTDLHEGDTIRVGVTHQNPQRDALDVTKVLERIKK